MQKPRRWVLGYTRGSNSQAARRIRLRHLPSCYRDSRHARYAMSARISVVTKVIRTCGVPVAL